MDLHELFATGSVLHTTRMWLMDTIILLAYLAGCMLFLIPTARFFLYMDGDCPADASDYAMSAVMAMTTVWFWPLYLPGWWIVQMLKTDEKSDR